MSKKNKNKFKKQIKAQMMQGVFQAQAQIQSPERAKTVSRENTVIANKIADTKFEAVEENSEFNLPQIRFDLKKTGIVVLCLAIVIGVLYYLDLKNGFLLNFGNWLFKVLNIK